MGPQTLTNLLLQCIYESFLQNEVYKQAFHKAEKSHCSMKASESYFSLYHHLSFLSPEMKANASTFRVQKLQL